MTYFLERIARLLYEETGGDLRRHCLVFPSRRAGLYILKYLSERIDKPVWSPAIMTINQFFGSFSELSVADNEILLLELYKVYRNLNPSAESFDEFYFWGDMLLSDFDDIDKYLADASVLFRNVSDFRTIDSQFGDIDEDIAEIIKRFWRNFDPEKPSPQKSDFKQIWSLLFDIYRNFNSSLRSQKIAYEGMIFREVITGIMPWNDNAFAWEKVHFIGFNALNQCEQEIMLQLQSKGIARFYWDYDNSYVNRDRLNSAGLFLSRNLRIFNNDMPDDWSYDTLLSKPAEGVVRRVFETTTDISQVKLLPGLVSQLPDVNSENAHHTAIILADEELLVPALSSLPENIEAVNITMGYPLRMTGVYGFIRQILNLQRNRVIRDNITYFDFGDVKNLINHKITADLLSPEEISTIEAILQRNLPGIPGDLLAGTGRPGLLFGVPSDPASFSVYLKEILMSVSAGGTEQETGDRGMMRKLEREFVYRIYLTVNRLEAVVQNPGVSFNTGTYIRMLDKILRNLSVPFTGEPLAGIQIMGILETRALDFRNIIMLSVNEGVLPSAGPGSSFVPYSIREAFGLPVINHQESIYAYHFYRLLHRAENVTFVYNSGSEGLETGEMSRFLIQMKYEHENRPVIRNLSFDIKSTASIGERVERSREHQEALKSRYLKSGSQSALSPTAINMWLNCRMKFLYRFVYRLREPSKFPPEVDYVVFGNMLHYAMKEIYAPVKGTDVTAGMLGSLISNRDGLLSAAGTAAGAILSKEPGIPLNGNELIARDVIAIYMSRLLQADRSIAPFRIIALEESHEFRQQVEVGVDEFPLRIAGNIDRIDLLNGTTRIVDYKTGDILHKICSIDDLFKDDRDKRLDCWLQTLLYCEAVFSKNQNLSVRPSVYVVKELTTEKFLDKLMIGSQRNNDVPVDSYPAVRPDFMSGLSLVLETIFNPEEPFVMTRDIRKCSYCAYRLLCQR
jgi:hypothetical protein